MKIVQLVFDPAPHFERKLRAIDARELRLFADFETVEASRSRAQLLPILRSANLIHVYAGESFNPSLITAAGTPFVSMRMPKSSRWPWSKPSAPARLIELGGRSPIPEAVDDSYFKSRNKISASPYRVGAFVGERTVRPVIDATGERLARVRDDIEWLLFDEPPSPAEIGSIDVWLDPALTDDDRDGFTAEAMASGVLPIASRTATNRWRLDEGRAGVLVPAGDPNEMAHAILGAIFKPESVAERVENVPLAAGRFRAVNRATALMRLYREVGR